MARPLKWAHNLHSIRDRISRTSALVFARKDIEELFGVRRGRAVELMHVIGDIGPRGVSLVDRVSLLLFVDELISSDDAVLAFQRRMGLTKVKRVRPLGTVPSPARLRELPPNIRVSAGRIEITGTAADITETLTLIATRLSIDQRFRLFLTLAVQPVR